MNIGHKTLSVQPKTCDIRLGIKYNSPILTNFSGGDAVKPGFLFYVICCLIFTACSSREPAGTDIPAGSAVADMPAPTITATAKPTSTQPKPTATVAQAIIAPPTKTPRPSATPTSTPSPEPTATPTPVDWLKTVGRTEAQLITLGNPDAPVTMVDYSDFL